MRLLSYVSAWLLLLLLNIPSATDAFSVTCGGQFKGWASTFDCQRLLAKIRDKTGLVDRPSGVFNDPIRSWARGRFVFFTQHSGKETRYEGLIHLHPASCELDIRFRVMGMNAFNYNTTYADVFDAFESILSNCTNPAGDLVLGSIMVDRELSQKLVIGNLADPFSRYLCPGEDIHHGIKIMV